MIVFIANYLKLINFVLQLLWVKFVYRLWVRCKPIKLSHYTLWSFILFGNLIS